MRLRPRTVFLLRLAASLALALALPSFPVLAQQRRGRTGTAQSKNAERAKRAEAAALLVETADKARLFDDLFYRARVQALAADALWPEDERQARAIFRRAWEAAEASDKAEQEESEQQSGTMSGSTPNFTEARSEVLSKVAAHDARLAEVFLHDMVGENHEKDFSDQRSRNEAVRAEMFARRLALASEMLEASETRRAAEIAAPLVNEAVNASGVNADLIAFIMRLRERGEPEAGSLYLRLLERAAAAPTDAAGVLLLSTYVVSPGLMVTVDDFGSLQFRVLPRAAANPAPAQPVPQKIQAAFYNLAASVLSRPLPPRDSLTMRDLVARFYAIGRLLPYFESPSSPYATYAPTLRARHSELFNELEAGRREQLSSQFDFSSLTPRGYADPLRSQAEELAHATDPQQRASIALSMVRTAVRNRFWDRARRAAAEIEDEAVRARVLSFIQIHQIKDITRAYEDDKEDDSESVAKFTRGADVPPFAKAWGLAQAATIAARKKKPADQVRQTVAELIDEAEDFASRVDQGTRERVAAYGVVTMAAARVDTERAWRLLEKTVEAANSVEDFTGDDASFDLAGDDAGETSAGAEEFSVEAEVFRLDQIFATMAHLDFDKALAEARALKGGEPEAFATIAVAKSRISGVRSQKSEGIRLIAWLLS